MTDAPLKMHAIEPPAHMADEAARLWLELAPQLTENGMLPPAVATSLEIACQAFSDWRLHTARVAEQGPLVKSPNGFAVQHPSIAIANRAAETWRKFQRQLGLDKKTKPKETGLAKLLKNRKAN